MDRLAKCKSAWTSATSDTERFSALFVVIKVLRSPDITEAQRREVFETIGFSFIKRLLMSEVPSGCPPTIFKALALSILSCFCRDPQIVKNNNKILPCLVTPINTILEDNINAMDEDEILEDAFDCLRGMSVDEKCQKAMQDVGVFYTLVNYYVDRERWVGILDIITCLVLDSELPYTDENQFALNNLMDKMFAELYVDNTEKKFELCAKVLSIMIKCPLFCLTTDTGTKMKKVLTEILQSRLDKEHRDMALKLASVLVEKFDTNNLSEDESEHDTGYFKLLLQISCVEITLCLDGKSLNDVAKDGSLLAACFTIMETVISGMVNGNWFQTYRKHASQLLRSIKMAMAAVVGFLKTAESEYDVGKLSLANLTPSDQILSATVRVTCAWLAEETYALQEEVCEVLPFILAFCEAWFKQLQSGAGREFDTINPLPFFLAPLCHLTAEDKSRKVLLDNGLLRLLFAFFDQQWRDFESARYSGLNNNIPMMCGIFLNLVVLEPVMVANSEDFFSFLKFLLNALPELLNFNKCGLVLKANFSVLGLLITKQCHKKVQLCETSFYRFLSSSIKFLWDAHHVEDEGDIPKFVTTRKYREVWSEIMELWFIGMQATSSLLPIMPWIAAFLLESGWPNIIMESLSIVYPSAVESNVIATYEALLSSLVRTSDTVAETMVTNNAILVCGKHQLTELESVLLNFASKAR